MNMIFALAAMIPPALPPSGPIYGRLECALEVSGQRESALVEIDEQNSERQVMLTGVFPKDADHYARGELGHGSLSIIGRSENSPLYRFDLLKTGWNGDWWQFRVAGSSRTFYDAGICFGKFNGRADRPITFTKIGSFKVEVTE